jgi:hypothetical protein
MVADGPRVRRRGMFLHVETPELDQVEHESAEGVSIRLRASRPKVEQRRQIVSVSSRKATHAVRSSSMSSSSEFRLATGTGSHRQARMSR